MNEIIKTIAETNEKGYNILKFIEESTELNDVLVKKITKEGTRKEPDLASIIEEIGDVELRLVILKQQLNCEEAVVERIEFKLNKYNQFLIEGKYKGRI